MRITIPLLWLAGVGQILIASANVFAWRMFGYRENMARLTPVVREVFIVQNVFIVFTVVCFGVMSIVFAPHLACGDDAFSRVFCGFLVLFWLIRLVVQVFFYDRDTRQKYPLFNVLFIAGFVYLVVIFGLAALRIGC
jgi:hypothetical protein